MPPMPKPEIPKPVDRSHQKMVDLDNDKQVEPPPDAKFLAQKNNRAEVETRATDTNLQKAQQGAKGSEAPSNREDTEVGDEKAKIAQLDDQKSALGRKAPEVTPHAEPELSQPEPPEPQKPKSLLALRDAPRREHELTPETVDPSLPRTADGTIAMPNDKGVRGQRSDADHLPRGKKMKLALTAKDYEYLFGADAAAERRLAQTERSKKVGRFQQRIGRVQSSLENFIPEVKPGNQTALNTRAAPFAAYIARMHRSIHALWGFGILEEWDEKSSSNPFNNRNLLTTLEIRLNPDGTVDKVTLVKTSGYMPYDAAAIDVAFNAGPYPDPPREIRSKNGKIYLHWRFYRDERQCATSGVDPFILDNPPADSDTVAGGMSERPADAVPAIGGGIGGRSAGPEPGRGPAAPGAEPRRGRGRRPRARRHHRGGAVRAGAGRAADQFPAARRQPPGAPAGAELVRGARPRRRERDAGARDPPVSIEQRQRRQQARRAAVDAAWPGRRRHRRIARRQLRAAGLGSRAARDHRQAAARHRRRLGRVVRGRALRQRLADPDPGAQARRLEGRRAGAPLIEEVRNP